MPHTCQMTTFVKSLTSKEMLYLHFLISSIFRGEVKLFLNKMRKMHPPCYLIPLLHRSRRALYCSWTCQIYSCHESLSNWLELQWWLWIINVQLWLRYEAQGRSSSHLKDGSLIPSLCCLHAEVSLDTYWTWRSVCECLCECITPLKSRWHPVRLSLSPVYGWRVMLY